MTVVDLEFAPRYVDDVLTGEKTLTLRYDPDGRLEDLAPGIPLRHVRADTGDPFARSVCDVVGTAPAAAWADVDLVGHRTYADVWDLIDHLATHYPAADIRPSTELVGAGWFRAISTSAKPDLGGPI